MFCTHKAGGDLFTAMRLINESHLAGQLALAADSFLVAEQIAAARIPIVVYPTMQRPEDIQDSQSRPGSTRERYQRAHMPHAERRNTVARWSRRPR